MPESRRLFLKKESLGEDMEIPESRRLFLKNESRGEASGDMDMEAIEMPESRAAALPDQNIGLDRESPEERRPKPGDEGTFRNELDPPDGLLSYWVVVVVMLLFKAILSMDELSCENWFA